ncbi:MAG: DNA-protecting protein DprA [Armatimonadetes bacterium]|nr:DNA-protecting protein DprA [Armatimonadota bacterium]
MRQQEFWQALLSLDLPPRKSRELLERLGTACLSADDLASSRVLSSSERLCLQEQKPLSEVQRRLLRVVSIEEDAYPANLRLLCDPPAALMVEGDLKPEDELAVAIVGTRRATPYGRAVARKLAADLAAGGVTVVSGGAHGIDAEAHAGALGAGGRTIVVAGSGLDRPYPAANRSLFARVVKNGAVLTQFALGTAPDYWRFPLRNYTIAGLVRAVVVVEAPQGSGSLSTANAAVDEGRHVFATPAAVGSQGHAGSFRLINDGATLLYTPDQVFEALGVERRVAEREPPELTDTQNNILERLTREPELVDNLSEALGLSAGVVLADLTKLEIEGLVARSAGGYVRL